MKTVEKLYVTVTYKVGWGNLEIPEDVYSQLIENEEIESGDRKTEKAMEWLAENAKEGECFDIKYEIDHIK